MPPSMSDNDLWQNRESETTTRIEMRRREDMQTRAALALRFEIEPGRDIAATVIQHAKAQAEPL